MTEIQLVDQTLRDGPQSLWGMRIRAGQMTAAGPHLDRAGFRVIEVPTTSPERLLGEDRWERLDWIRQILPTATLRMARLAQSTGGFNITPHCMIDLTIQTYARHGVNSFWVFDCLYNLAAIERTCRAAVNAGAEALPGVMFGDAPVLTDDYFAGIVREFASWDVSSGIFVEDAPGILHPLRTPGFVRAIVEAAGDLPVELHCHNTTGTASINYMEAVKHGVRVLHTASQPLANGPSLPSTEATLDNLELSGHSHGIDRGSLPPVAQHLEKVARQEGFPIGTPSDFDVAAFMHQLPGGMTGTLKAQLREHGMENRFGDVLREIPNVRADLGHPVSATPFSQFMGVQAVLNVTTGDRYSMVPDEIIKYVLGHFGSPPAPINENVKDRVLSLTRAKEFLHWEAPQPTLGEIRQQYGLNLTDEDLLLRYFTSPEDLACVRPLERDYTFLDEPTVTGLLEEVLKRQRIGQCQIQVGESQFSFRRQVRSH
jgi:oxaloacetate decarboxylase alpha subunit